MIADNTDIFDSCMTITFENESKRGMGQYKGDGGGGGEKKKCIVLMTGIIYSTLIAI